MNVIDLILVIPLLFALYRGFTKGLVYMVASLVALVLGILGAMKFREQMAGLLDRIFEVQPQYLNLLGFAVTFVIIVLLVHLTAFLADKLIKAVALNFINRLAGMVFGVAISAFIISIILQPVQAANEQRQFISSEKIEGSLLYKPLAAFAPTVFPYLKRDEFRKFIPGKNDNTDTPEENEV